MNFSLISITASQLNGSPMISNPRIRLKITNSNFFCSFSPFIQSVNGFILKKSTFDRFIGSIIVLRSINIIPTGQCQLISLYENATIVNSRFSRSTLNISMSLIQLETNKAHIFVNIKNCEFYEIQSLYSKSLYGIFLFLDVDSIISSCCCSKCFCGGPIFLVNVYFVHTANSMVNDTVLFQNPPDVSRSSLAMIYFCGKVNNVNRLNISYSTILSIRFFFDRIGFILFQYGDYSNAKYLLFDSNYGNTIIFVDKVVLSVERMCLLNHSPDLNGSPLICGNSMLTFSHCYFSNFDFKLIESDNLTTFFMCYFVNINVSQTQAVFVDCEFNSSNSSFLSYYRLQNGMCIHFDVKDNMALLVFLSVLMVALIIIIIMFIIYFKGKKAEKELDNLSHFIERRNQILTEYG